MDAPDAPWPPFRITIDYVEADILAYWDVLTLRHRRQHGRFQGWWIVGTGVAFGFVGALAAIALGVVQRDNAALLAFLLFIGFWIGVWSPWLWATTERRLFFKRSLAEVLERSANASALISWRGIATRRVGARGFHSRAVIAAVTIEKGLLLIWSSPNASRAIAAIPLRVLDATQRERILSLPTKR